MNGYIETAVVALAGMIALLCLIVGLEKMIRIIMANYLISSILLGLSNLIDLVSERLLVGPDTERWVDTVENRLAHILMAGKPTVMLTVYFILLLFLVTRSNLGFGKVKHDFMRRILLLILLPCAVVSVMFTLGMAVFGTQILDLQQLKVLASTVAPSVPIYNVMMLTPLWIVLPGLITFVIAAFFLRTSEEKVRKVVEFETDGDDDNEDK